MGEDVSAEGVVRREPPKLRKHLIRADVVGPCGCHGALESERILFAIAGGGYALDTAELSESVDSVGLEGLDELAGRL